MVRARMQLTVLSLVGLLATSAPTWAASATRTSGFEYDPISGLLTKESVEPDQPELRLDTAYTYDAFGNKTQVVVSSPATGQAAIEPRSSSTGYDPQGRLALTATNALGHTETRTYDTRFDAITSLTGPNGLTTAWSYDDFGRKTLEIRADGTRTTWDYLFCAGVNGGTTTCPPHAKYLVQTIPLASDGATQNGPWVKTYFDALDREVQVETQGFDGRTVVVSTEYDALGRVARKSRPYFAGEMPKWTVFAYDAIGRVVRETRPDASLSTIAYAGLVTTATNALDQFRTTTRDSQDRVVQVEEGKAGELTTIITFAFDPFGNLTRITDAAGNVTTLTYDGRGRKVAMADPNMGTWTYAYDALGQLVSQTDAKGQATTTAYDKLGRMTSRTEPGLVSTWSYDSAVHGIGKLAQASADNGYARIHTYDALGRPSSTSISIGGAGPYVFANTYDADGRLATVTYPSGFAVRHTYTALGDLAEVRDDVTGALYWRADTANAEGRLTQIAHGNGLITTKDYDPNTGWLTGVRAGANDAVQSLSFQYDVLGNLRSRTDATQNLTESFGYDALNRLISASIPDVATKTVQYDTIGNVIQKSDVGTYVYNPAGAAQPHAVQSVSGALNATYAYDANGNMLSGAGRTVTWTSFNMPEAIARGATTLTFAYDTEHRRTRQVDPDGTTLYLSDAASGVMVEKFTGTTGATRWSNYVFVAGEIAAVVYEDGASPTLTRYFHNDHLGSIAVITDEAGRVVERLSYDAWGMRRFANGQDDPSESITSLTNRGFTGHEHLEEVGLVHMNGRVYDPALGRFTSADPLIQDPFNAQSLNRYSYVLNNPLAHIDPSGYLSLKKVLRNPIFGVAAGLAASWVMGPGGFGLYANVFSIEGAIVAGTVSGGLGGGVKGAIIGGVSGAFTSGIGGLDLGLGQMNFLGQAALHGIAQGTFAEMQGGKFGAAFLAGSFSKLGSTATPSVIRGDALGAVIARGVATAVIGGTAASIGGGKFENGAATAAFVYLFNECGDGGCFESSAERDIRLNAQDPARYWAMKCASREPGACEFYGVVTKTSDLGILAEERMKIMAHNMRVPMPEWSAVSKDFMNRYGNYQSRVFSETNPGYMGRGTNAILHHQTFNAFGLPAATFGGTPIPGAPNWIMFGSKWCAECPKYDQFGSR